MKRPGFRIDSVVAEFQGYSEAVLVRIGLRLATLDLARLREGDMLNLAWDCEYLTKHATGVYGRITDRRSWKETTLEEWTALQRDVQQLFNDFIVSRDTRQLHTALHIQPAVALAVHDAQPVLEVSGSRRDVLLFVLMHLITRADTRDRIQKCGAEGCTNLFYREGKEKFCSRRCTNRAGRQRFLEKQTQTQKKRESDKAHKRYRKRVQEKLGPTVQVQRRQRKTSKGRN